MTHLDSGNAVSAARRLVIVMAVLVFGTVGVALAHATLRRAEPPNGAHLAVPPAVLRLEFSEAVVPRTSRIELIVPDSQRIGLQVTGDSAMANVLVAHVPELSVSGAYRVEWRLVGPDGHAVSGKYGFTVDSIPGPRDTAVRAPPEQPKIHEPSSDSLGQQVIRFASSLALLTMIGSIAFALFVLPAGLGVSNGPTSFRDSVDGRLRSLAVVGAWSLLALAVIRLVSHGAMLSGSTAALSVGDLADLLTASTFGRGWFLQVVATIGSLLVLRFELAARWRILAGIAVALAFSASMLGHPAAVGDVPFLAVGTDAIHVLAAGGWVGAILVMSIAAIPQVVKVSAGDRLVLARNLLRAFSPLALTCAAVLIITGSISAWLQLRDVGLVLDSAYGLALLRKVVIVLAIAALGAYHWRVAQPSLDSERSIERLHVSLVFDIVLILLVLVLTAILTGTAPPMR